MPAAAALLRDLADGRPAAALGLLVCSLVTGEPFDRTLDLDPDEADRALRDWLAALWSSRRPDLLAACAGRAASVAAVFPWLPDHLAAETRRLAVRA